MGNSNSCIRHLKDVLSSLRGGSTESEICQTARAASGGECATRSGAAPDVCAGSESTTEGTPSGNLSSVVEERIEMSMVHWSQLAEPESDRDDEEVAADNRKVFTELQSHSTWGEFFQTFGDDGVFLSAGSLEIGEKFAEGGQAELFHAHVTWRDPDRNEGDRELGTEWVVKVFKKGTRLRHLQKQWPHGYLQWWAEDSERFRLNLVPETQYTCDVFCGTLLKDGRFAFLMVKEHEDLRSLIDRTVLSIRDDCGPFSEDEAERIMFAIALGMDWLHRHNIVHRDLKAANVLIDRGIEGRYLSAYYVADFECSIGVVGTGFFRAPEILQAIKNKVVDKNPHVFSKEADVYSYGMTCYEVLTGKLPFEGHHLNDYELVLKGQRPKMPKYVEDWVRELLSRCWHEDPTMRPSFGEIMDMLLANSASARRVQLIVQKWEEEWMRKYGERLLWHDMVVVPQEEEEHS